MIVCAGKSEQFAFAVPIGIGLIETAISLAKICIEKTPESITFVGTAGSYGNRELMEIVHSEKACNIEQAFLRRDAYSPIENRVHSVGNVSHETWVNASNYICTNTEIAQKYLKMGIEIENMEFYAVLKVAEQFGIPAKGIFIVTNYCDKNAHKDFLKNHKEAMQTLSAYIRDRTGKQ